ncbi:NUDIX domain-containing protein [Asanoa sp. NPDC049518]|uniref:NUDIX hydrolase n=1 Tax=unclassified Asanoa TaxID=2685164 RepID=UPI00343F772A
MTNPQHSVSVAAVITDDQNRILVIQRRDNGQWQIPGGILERDESIHDGVRREVNEETRLTVEPERLTGVYKNVKVGVVALVFKAHVTAGEPGPTEESAAVDWWTVDRVTAEMNETFAVRVTDALRGHDTAVRIHDGVTLIAG